MQESPSSATLIVNADDLGLSPGVNAGVLAAFRQGIVRSASLMATQPFAPPAVRLAVEAGLDLGLHLNLTTGRPLSPPEDVPSLVTRSGKFHPLFPLLLRLLSGRVDPAHLRRELEAQLTAAITLGARPSHLNGHHHIHAFPLVDQVVLDLAAEHGLAVRSSVEWPSSARPRELVRSIVISLPAQRLRARARQRGIRSSNAFRGIALGYGFDARALASTLRRLPPGLTELMCHPGYPDAELAAATRYAAGRERELAALTDPAIRRLIDARHIQLTSWRDLHNRA